MNEKGYVGRGLGFVAMGTMALFAYVGFANRHQMYPYQEEKPVEITRKLTPFEQRVDVLERNKPDGCESSELNYEFNVFSVGISITCGETTHDAHGTEWRERAQ